MGKTNKQIADEIRREANTTPSLPLPSLLYFS